MDSLSSLFLSFLYIFAQESIGYFYDLLPTSLETHLCGSILWYIHPPLQASRCHGGSIANTETRRFFGLFLEEPLCEERQLRRILLLNRGSFSKVFFYIGHPRDTGCDLFPAVDVSSCLGLNIQTTMLYKVKGMSRAYPGVDGFEGILLFHV